MNNGAGLIFVVAPLLLLASTVLQAQQEGEVMPSQEQVQEVERSEQSHVQPDPEIPAPPPQGSESATSADQERQLFEQQLWELFGRGQYSEVRRRIAERSATLPVWQPPVALQVELKRAEGRVEIAAAKSDPRRLIALRKRYPELFTCREYYHLWSLADAHAAVEEQPIAAEIHQQMLASCRDPKVLLTTLDRIAEGDGPGAALAGVEIVERHRVKLPAKELAQRLYGWRVSHAVALHGEGRLVEAGTFLAAVESAVITRRDLGMARLIAWNYRERGDNVSAAKWFERVVAWSGSEEDRLHLLQLQWDADEHATVIESLRREPLREARARQWAAEILRGEAARTYETRAYAEAIALLDAALLYDSHEPTSITALRGWACLELKRYADAHRAFADAYRATLDAELASGLLYTAQRGGDWQALLAVANSVGGPILATEGERALAQQLAEGKLVASQITVEEGRLVRVAESKTAVFSRVLHLVEGYPGFTWGSLDSDSTGDRSVSYLVNQGVDWVKLPGDIMLATYVEYRAIDNEWRYLRDETEGAVGLELKRSPFHLGVEYLPNRWRNGEQPEDSRSKAYLSWYHDWYEFLRRKRGGGANPLGVDAYSGSTYGRINHDLRGEGGTSILGFIKHGVDWVTFADDITFHTYGAYRFRFRNWDNYWYDAHGPAVGMELQKPPFTLGVDYSWRIYPEQDTSSRSTGLYLNWYYGWDLMPQ